MNQPPAAVPTTDADADVDADNNDRGGDERYELDGDDEWQRDLRRRIGDHGARFLLEGRHWCYNRKRYKGGSVGHDGLDE